LTADKQKDRNAPTSASQAQQTVPTVQHSEMQDAVTSEPMSEQLAETMLFLLARTSVQDQHLSQHQLMLLNQLLSHQHQLLQNQHQLL